MTAATWTLENVFTPEVRDYIANLEDANGHSGSLRLTIDETTRTAEISVLLDNAEESIFFEKNFSVPFAWAWAITRKDEAIGCPRCGVKVPPSEILTDPISHEPDSCRECDEEDTINAA